MAYKPARTFDGTVGQASTGQGGPDYIEADIDTINKMFDPDTTHGDSSPGGIGTGNIQNDAITKALVNADVAGNGLGQNVDGSLEAKVDASTIEISANTLRLKDSGTNDTKIGNRTVDQAIATAYANTGTLTQILSWIVKVILAMKGTVSNWYDDAATTLEAIGTHITDDVSNIKHSLATAANDFLVSSGAGAFVKKTLTEVKTILGLGSAAYLNGNVNVAAGEVIKLDADNGNTNGGFYRGAATAPTGTTRLNYSGYFYPTRCYNAGWNDYAEYFERDENTESGDIIMLNPNGGGYCKAVGFANPLVSGVHSDCYGHIVGGNGDEYDDENFIPVGLCGRVLVKVIGKVKKGQYIVSSDIPGVGIAIDEIIQGAVIGRAEEDKEMVSVSKVRMFIMRI